MKTELVLWFENLRKTDIPSVGGKNANLGELTNAGIHVPPGFAITAFSYKRFIQETGISSKIYEIIKDTITNPNEPKLYETASKKIRELIEATPMPKDIENAIRSTYEELCRKLGIQDVFVAVRSSATAEDLADASFAGQQEPFLNVRGEAAVLDACRRCFASLFTHRAISYREAKGFEHLKVALSIGVQQMVRSDLAGHAVSS